MPFTSLVDGTGISKARNTNIFTRGERVCCCGGEQRLVGGDGLSVCEILDAGLCRNECD